MKKCMMGECDGREGVEHVPPFSLFPQGESGAPYRGVSRQATGCTTAEGRREHKVRVCEETAQGK